MIMLIMATVALTASAQKTLRDNGTFTLQPKAGIGMGYISGSFKGGWDPKAKFGFVGGIEGEYYMGEWFSAALGVNYAQQGWKMDQGSSTVTTSLNYLNLPVVANFYVAQGLALKTGFQVGFLMSAEDGGHDAKDICESTAFAIPVGVSYEISNVVLDFRYNIGITAINKAGDSQRSDLIQFTVGYKFEL